MAKRKKRNSKNTSRTLTYIAWTLALIAVILGSLISGYYFGYQDAKEEAQKKEKFEKHQRLLMLKKSEKVVSKKEEKAVNDRLKEVLKKESKYQVSASHEYDDPSLDKPHERAASEIKVTPAKPKLAIIIDDMSVRSQVNAIKSLGLHLTMSFLPPSKIHPNSAVLASHEKRYMVHLPLEALNFSHSEPNTLKVGDSQEKISKRIEELKRMFPRVHYINNHTGSKFTSNEIAMNRLIYALKSNGIYFIDSRTTADTKVPKVMENFGLKYMARDVFLDHDMDKEAVKKQIKRAVALAKEYGSAIAIGHPHVNTILALSESKKLFKDVDLVYINQLN
jgi:uncharacterized protein